MTAMTKLELIAAIKSIDPSAEIPRRARKVDLVGMLRDAEDARRYIGDLIDRGCSDGEIAIEAEAQLGMSPEAAIGYADAYRRGLAPMELEIRRLRYVYRAAEREGQRGLGTLFKAAERLYNIAREQAEDLSDLQAITELETMDDVSRLLKATMLAMAHGKMSPTRGAMIIQSVPGLIKTGTVGAPVDDEEDLGDVESLTLEEASERAAESLRPRN